MKTILKKEYWNKISNKLIPIFVFLIIFGSVTTNG